MPERLELNLNRERVFCYENGQNHYLVENMIRGIQGGDSFKPVHMFKRVDGVYELINGCTHPTNGGGLTREGGHHATLAHYKAKKVLLVEVYTQEELDALVKREHFSKFSDSTIPLSSLETKKDLEHYFQIMSKDVNYRRNHDSNILRA